MHGEHTTDHRSFLGPLQVVTELSSQSCKPPCGARDDGFLVDSEGVVCGANVRDPPLCRGHAETQSRGSRLYVSHTKWLAVSVNAIGSTGSSMTTFPTRCNIAVSNVLQDLSLIVPQGTLGNENKSMSVTKGSRIPPETYTS